MSDKRSARQRRARSLAVSGWPLRRKLALSLAIPLLLAATLGGLRVSSDLAEASNAAASSQQVTVLRPAVAYLSAAERAMVAAQGGTAASAKDLDAAVRQLRSLGSQLLSTAKDADLTADQRYQVDALLDLSQSMRAEDAALSGGTWLAQLRQLQSGVSQLITSIANAQLEPLPQLQVLSDTLEGRFSLAMQQALAQTDRTGETGSQDLFAEIGVEGAAIDSLASALGAAQAEAVAALRTANADRSRSVRTGSDDLGGVEAYDDYDALATSLLGGIDSRLASAADTARTSALVNAGAVAGGLLLALLLALLVSRALLRPIRTVREGALTIAHEQLPEQVRQIRAGAQPTETEPIAVATEEEIGQLARAVDDLHRQAVLLASGEAALRAQVSEMFVILSRRTNSLINQQLAQIEALEKDEEDPRRLDSLFRLDHLAARMRRTSDSLLILADAPTRGAAQEALSVSDTMQAATSGVQDYQRVRLGSASHLHVSATASSDVVHLLTELIDNALSFSPPTTAVALTSAISPSGLTIEVVDAGLGVPAESLGDLNRLLRSGGDITPDTARRMGLFVVSRLAQRHGILVTLRRNEHEGMTASVTLPPDLLVGDGRPATPTLPTLPAAPQMLQPVEPLAPVAPLVPVPAPVEPVPVEPVPVVPVEVRAEPRPPAAATPPTLPRRQPGASDVPGAPMLWPVPTPAPDPDPAPLAPPAPRTAADYLDLPPARPAVVDEDVTPIFASMRSGWLGADPQAGSWSSTEVEAGWERADLVTTRPAPSHPTTGGLPVRSPGAQLVPGGVAKPATTVRDPEAIRARLSAHAAGVSRGRSAATTAGIVDDTTTKAGH